MARRGARSGKLAQSIFTVGDVDSGGATAADRMAIIDDTERVVLKNAEGGVKLRTGEILEQIERHETRLGLRAQRRDQRLDVMSPKLEMAARWRALGAQERYPHTELPVWALVTLFLVLAGLDFYVFAQAYAFVDDVADFSAQWWLGGLLGLTVFLAGLVVARQLKSLMVGKAQEETLRLIRARHESKGPETPVDQVDLELIPLNVPAWSIAATGVLFTALCASGIWVRYEATSDGIGALLLPALVPFAVILVELYLYDPLFRHGPRQGFVDRRLQQRVNRLKFRHDNVLQAYESFTERTRASYDMERSNAMIIAADLGMVLARDQSLPGTDSGSSSSGSRDGQ